MFKECMEPLDAIVVCRRGLSCKSDFRNDICMKGTFALTNQACISSYLLCSLFYPLGTHRTHDLNLKLTGLVTCSPVDKSQFAVPTSVVEMKIVQHQDDATAPAMRSYTQYKRPAVKIINHSTKGHNKNASYDRVQMLKVFNGFTAGPFPFIIKIISERHSQETVQNNRM